MLGIEGLNEDNLFANEDFSIISIRNSPSISRPDKCLNSFSYDGRDVGRAAIIDTSF